MSAEARGPTSSHIPGIPSSREHGGRGLTDLTGWSRPKRKTADEIKGHKASGGISEDWSRNLVSYVWTEQPEEISCMYLCRRFTVCTCAGNVLSVPVQVSLCRQLQWTVTQRTLFHYFWCSDGSGAAGWSETRTEAAEVWRRKKVVRRKPLWLTSSSAFVLLLDIAVLWDVVIFTLFVPLDSWLHLRPLNTSVTLGVLPESPS